MFIDHKKTSAAASASFCVRSPVAAALLCCGLLGVGLVHAQAQAQDGQRRDPPQHQQSGGRSEASQPRSSDPRQLDPRRYEERAEEQRRAMQEASRNAEMNRRVGRMTPDERRDLRRQINEVGQDLYAVPPKR
jgi:hypothetical protein